MSLVAKNLLDALRSCYDNYMKNLTTKQQNNSKHILLISIISVAVIGALAFLYWQNFLASENSLNSEQDEDSIESDNEASVGTKEYVVLDKWGVKFDAPGGDTDIKWAVTADSPDSIGFSTSNLTESDVCTASNGAAGTLQRSKEPMTEETGSTTTIINDNKPINGYYYGFILPNGSHCEDTDPSDYDEALRVSELVGTLVAN